MTRSPHVGVTLSDDLLNHLRKTAQGSTFAFAGWLPVWSVTLWRPGLNTTMIITFSVSDDNGRMLKSLR